MKKFMFVIYIILLICPIVVFAESEEVQLESCVDGDTAKFKSADGSITTYRFLAIDTPETVHPTKGVEPLGKAASEYTCNTLVNANKIILEFDDNAGKVDKYGRGLAWVFADDIFLQEQLVAQGYAEVAYLYGDYKYNAMLQDIEAVAKSSKVGIWSDDTPVVSDDKEQAIEDEKPEKNKNFIEKMIDSILEMITASINEMIDSILQKLDDML